MTGEIVDKNGNPLEGAELKLSGIRLKGNTPVPNFMRVITASKKDGIYEIKQIIPDGNDVISILYWSTILIPLGNPGEYSPQIFLDNNYLSVSSPFNIPRVNWGRTTILNYQYI